MKIVRVLCFYMMISMAVSAAWATPPLSVDLEYSFKNHVLSVNAEHPSANLKKNYIRKMEVSVNQATPQEEYYHRQSDKTGFTADVPLVLAAGDQVAVKLYCREGGTKEAILIIPEPEVMPETGE